MGVGKSGIWVVFLTFLSGSVNVLAQCPQGAIGVSGAGCGCLSGCNLTSFGGPNCGSGTSGNCSAGYISMQVDIVVPDGCTFTVTALMQNRPGCSASGADGSCSTCDRLKVDIPAGSKPMQTGGSNASLSDSYTLTGPGTIRVSGGANRADEIITYSTTYSGIYCDACASILPVEFLGFSAAQEDESVALQWTTASEENNAYFVIERSVNGIDYEPVIQVEGNGNSSSRMDYKIYDSKPPLADVIYYRIWQVDWDGNQKLCSTTSMHFMANVITSFEGVLQVDLRNFVDHGCVVRILDLTGNEITRIESETAFINIPWEKRGVFIVQLPELNWSAKFSSVP